MQVNASLGGAVRVDHSEGGQIRVGVVLPWNNEDTQHITWVSLTSAEALQLGSIVSELGFEAMEY